jgi:hypothetical protein
MCAPVRIRFYFASPGQREQPDEEKKQIEANRELRNVLADEDLDHNDRRRPKNRTQILVVSPLPGLRGMGLC